MSGLATLTVQRRIATLTLNRPDARNALSRDLLRALHERVDELVSQDGVTVLIVTGAGKSFCAGMDLKAVTSPEGLKAGLPGELLSVFADLMLRIRRLPMVAVAKVNGAAIGGGCGLATACDIALTHADSKMGFPEVDLGVCPAVVAPWLVRKVGHGRARRILLSGNVLTGRQAGDLGVVDHVVESREDLDGSTDEVVARLASGGMGALRATKALLNELDGSPDEGLSRRSAGISADVFMSDEAQAMMRARLNA